MSNKKYFWLKLKDDFFRQKEIKKLRKIAGGDTYTIIYLKMLLLAIKNDNKLYFDGVEDNFSSELALELDEEEDNVKVTLNFLLSQRLAEMINEDEILLTEGKCMTGSETPSASRVRRFREKKKELGNNENLLQCNTKTLQSNTDVTLSNKNVTTETEQEKETEIYTEQETEKETEKEKQQHIEENDVVGLVKSFFPYMNEKDINSVKNEFFKTNKDLYYLTEKLILTVDSRSIENKVGFLLKAIEQDYQINYVTSFENLVYIWEHELLQKPNNLIIANKVKYYKYKYEHTS